MVPQQFVVPESAPWPEETWGLKLGARVNSIRQNDCFEFEESDLVLEVAALFCKLNHKESNT